MDFYFILSPPGISLCSSFSFPSFVTGQFLDKAFTTLNAGEYNYFQELLYRIAGRNDNPAAEYWLSQIYFLKDNKKYNLDSGNRYSLRSAAVLKVEKW